MDSPAEAAPTVNGELDDRKLTVVVCGGLNWDMITVTNRMALPGETYNSKSFDELPGGKGANAAIALHRLSHVDPATDGEGGNDETPAEPSTEPPPPLLSAAPRNAYADEGMPDVEVRMVGAVGADMRGTKMKRSLRAHHVDTDGVTVRGTRSGMAVTVVNIEGGENSILVYPGANHLPQRNEFVDVACFGPRRPDLVVAQLELNSQSVAQLLSTAKRAGIETMLNPSPAYYLDEPVYRGLTHLILNESEAAILTDRDPEELADPGFKDWITITDEFLERGVLHVVVTLGARGAFYSEEPGLGYLVDAVKLEPAAVADTSGAGDTFIGAYAIQWLRQRRVGKWNMRATVEYACKASAQVVQVVGCQVSIPWASHLLAPDVRDP